MPPSQSKMLEVLDFRNLTPGPTHSAVRSDVAIVSTYWRNKPSSPHARMTALRHEPTFARRPTQRGA
jgi:hypothetical protein